MRRIAFALLAFAAFFSAAPGAAEARDVTISLADLDFSQAAEADTALDRVKAAAKRACREEHANLAVLTYSQRRKCVADTISRTITVIASADLSARYAERMADPVRLASR